MKQKSVGIIAFSFVLLAFSSCKKEKQSVTTVDGRVDNRLTGMPVKNVPIDIIECTGVLQKCLTVIKTVYTDEKGFFTVNFQQSSKKSYAVSVGVNDIVGSTPSPYMLNGSNGRLINFSQFPIKTLKLTVKVLRHNKNWLIVTAGNKDSYDFYSASFYNDLNPVVDFDRTYYERIQAGREYAVFVELSNKTAPYSYTDRETFSKNFTVANADTTVVDFVVP
jgi:hypothetical protein